MRRLDADGDDRVAHALGPPFDEDGVVVPVARGVRVADDIDVGAARRPISARISGSCFSDSAVNRGS